MKRTGIILLLVLRLAAQSPVLRQGSSPSGNVDFSGATTTKPARTGGILPGSCSANELFFLANVGLHQCVKGKFAPVGNGGTWGTVGGTIAAQTDLWNALQSKQPQLNGTQSQYVRGDGSLSALAASATTDTTQATNITVASGGAGAIQRTIASKFSDYGVSVRDFGAKGDGTTDDTAAITNAIAAANQAGARLYIPSGTYIIAPPTANGILPVYSGLTVAGDGMGNSILKIKAGAGPYFSVFGFGYVAVSNVAFRDLTVDQNSANNPVISQADLTSHPRFLIGDSTSTSNLVFDHVEVTNIQATNVIYAGSTNVQVTNCRFTDIGNAPFAYDHSTLYIAGDTATISNNIMSGYAAASKGAATAIETHGGHHTITGNVVENMSAGMNITGITTSDSEGIVISGNSIAGALFGIELWSSAYANHSTGYGLNGVTVTNNRIRINQLSYPGNTMGNHGGIVINPANNLPVANISIANNDIVYDLENSPSAPISTAAIGIGYYDATAANSFLNVSIRDNTVINPPAFGIRMSVAGSGLTIVNNKVLNPGSTLNTLGSSYRSGIFVYSTAAIPQLVITGNQIVDNLSTTRMYNGMYINTGNAGDIALKGNTISVTGSTTSAFNRAYVFGNAGQMPLIQDSVNVPTGTAFPPLAVAGGSTIHSLANNKLYTVKADGVTWVDVLGSLQPVAMSGSASDLSTGTLPAARMPAFTGGDLNSPVGTVNATVVKVNGAAVPVIQPVVGTNSSGQLVPSTVGAILSGGCAGTISNATTIVLFPFQPLSYSCNSGTAFAGMPIRAGTIKNLRVVASAPSNIAGSGIVTVWSGGTSTALTCTLGTSTTCQDLTHAVQNGATSQVTIKVATLGSYVSTGPIYSSGLSGCTNGAQAITFTNGTTGVAATGTITVAGGVPTGAVTITGGGTLYTAAPTQGTVATCTGTGTFTGAAITADTLGTIVASFEVF